MLLLLSSNSCAKVPSFAGNFGGAKIHFGASAGRTATETFRIVGGIHCLAWGMGVDNPLVKSLL